MRVIYLSIPTVFLLLAACGEGGEERAGRLETEAEATLHDGLTAGEVATVDSLTLDSLRGLARRQSDIDRLTLEDSLRTLYDALDVARLGLTYPPFRYAMIGYLGLRQEGRLSDRELLSIIDFTQSSRQKRFYTLDLKKKQVVFNTFVSHGRNTGTDLAQRFGNEARSNLSSLGFYVTGETYTGSKGYALRLDGQEQGYNDNLRRRAVVMHDADYVSEAWIKSYGRIGRSQGCPALPKDVSRRVINTIKDHTAIFAYYHDEAYLKASAYLDLHRLMKSFTADSLQAAQGRG